VGLGGWWQIGSDWTVRARVENLTNRRYETFVGFPGAGLGFWLGLGWRSL
jgi:outer membrane cobalamin receptor